MYLLFPGASLKIARNLIQVTGTHEIWVTLRQQSTSKAPPRNLWREVLGLNVCNLAQTMTEDAVDRELDPEDRQDILEDFVMEILRAEKWEASKDGAERMDHCMEVLAVSERLKPHFNRTRVAQGLKPRREAVRDLLFNLGLGSEAGLQKALTALIDSQHQRFVDYFKGLFDPLGVEEELGPAPEQKATPVEEETAIEDQAMMPVAEETPIPAPQPVSSELLDLDSVMSAPLTGKPFIAESQVAMAPELFSEAPLAEEMVAQEVVPQELSALEPVMPETEVQPEQPEMMVVETAEVPPLEGSPQEAWVEEGAVAESGIENEAVPFEESPRSPLDLSIQPLTRPKPSFGRSVDPQKLAKVLEYLLSPADSPLPKPSSEGASSSNPETGDGMSDTMTLPGNAPEETPS